MLWKLLLIIVLLKHFCCLEISQNNQLKGRLLESNSSDSQESDQNQFVHFKAQLRKVKSNFDKIKVNYTKIAHQKKGLLNQSQINQLTQLLQFLKQEQKQLKQIEKQIKEAKQLIQLHKEVLAVLTKFLNKMYHSLFTKISLLVGPFKTLIVKKEVSTQILSQVEEDLQDKSVETDAQRTAYKNYKHKLKSIKHKIVDKQPQLQQVTKSINGTLTNQQKSELQYLQKFTQKIRKKLKKYYSQIKDNPDITNKDKNKLQKAAKKYFNQVLKVKQVVQNLLYPPSKQQQSSKDSESSSESTSQKEQNTQNQQSSSTSQKSKKSHKHLKTNP